MISVKCFVIERAVDFITILEEDFPDSVTNTLFTSSFPRFSMTSLIGYRNHFSFVYMSCINYFLSMLIFFNLDSLCEIVSFS